MQELDFAVLGKDQDFSSGDGPQGQSSPSHKGMHGAPNGIQAG